MKVLNVPHGANRVILALSLESLNLCNHESPPPPSLCKFAPLPGVSSLSVSTFTALSSNLHLMPPKVVCCLSLH